jgi:hypothetical protein
VRTQECGSAVLWTQRTKGSADRKTESHITSHHITFDVPQYCFTNAHCIAVFSKTKLYILPFIVAVCDVLFGLLIISSSNPKFLF